MWCIWDIAIRTPSLLPVYVPFELCEKFGIRFGPPPTFWDNVPHFCFFLKASLTSFVLDISLLDILLLLYQLIWRFLIQNKKVTFLITTRMLILTWVRWWYKLCFTAFWKRNHAQVLFIATGNILWNISRPLLDRMEIIQVLGYNFEDLDIKEDIL